MGSTWIVLPPRLACWGNPALRQVEIQNKWLGIIQCTMQARIKCVKFRVKANQSISKHIKTYIYNYSLVLLRSRTRKTHCRPDRCGRSNEGGNKAVTVCTSMPGQTAMVTYIVFGIFIYNQGYLDYEPSRGVESKFQLKER